MTEREIESIVVQTRWPKDLLARLDAFVAERERVDPARRTTRTEMIHAAVDAFLRRHGHGPRTQRTSSRRDDRAERLAQDPEALLVVVQKAAEDESLRALARRAGLPDQSTGVLLSRWRTSGQPPSLRIRRAIARVLAPR